MCYFIALFGIYSYHKTTKLTPQLTPQLTPHSLLFVFLCILLCFHSSFILYLIFSHLYIFVVKQKSRTVFIVRPSPYVCGSITPPMVLKSLYQPQIVPILDADDTFRSAPAIRPFFIRCSVYGLFRAFFALAGCTFGFSPLTYTKNSTGYFFVESKSGGNMRQ